jgi:hypothetical protein
MPAKTRICDANLSHSRGSASADLLARLPSLPSTRSLESRRLDPAGPVEG